MLEPATSTYNLYAPERIANNLISIYLNSSIYPDRSIISQFMKSERFLILSLFVLLMNNIDANELQTAIKQYLEPSHFDKVRKVLEFFSRFPETIMVEGSRMANPAYVIVYLHRNLNYEDMSKYKLKRRFTVGFLFWTGIRVSEMTMTKRENVDLIGRTFNVPTAKQRKTTFRAIPLNHVPRAELNLWLHYFERYGISQKDRIIKSNKRAIERLVKDETGFNPHSLRHGLGLFLYELTKDIRLVSLVLRHTNISNTLIYTRLSLDGVREKLEY